MRDQYGRIVSAIEYTLDQLRRGPRAKLDEESSSKYMTRCEVWYDHKFKFTLFAIRCLKDVDKGRAETYLNDLRQIRDDI